MRAKLALLLSLLAASAAAQLPPVDATKRPVCVDGKPWSIWLLNESSSSDCDAVAGGTSEAFCCCKEGAVAACASGGSGTVTSVALAVPAEWSVSGSPVTGSGTITVSEATQSANAVYAGPTSGSAAAPGFRALVAADLTAASPYDQYDPDRPPSSCAVCDEFTSSPSLTWDTTNGMDGGSATAEYDSYTIAHNGTNETGAIWTDSPSSGNTDFTVTVKLIQWGVGSNDGCGIAFLAAGTTTTPTDIRAVWEQTGTGAGFVVGNATSYTAVPSAASSDTSHFLASATNTSGVYLQARYVDSTRAITGWVSYDGRHFFQIGASATTASADPAKFGVLWRDDPTCVVQWIRARTDANKNDAGE